VYRLAYNGEVAAGQLAAFSRRSEPDWRSSAHIWIHTGRSAAAEEKQPTGRGPEGCVENGPAAALLVGYVPHHFCTGGRKPDRQERKMVRDAPSSRETTL